MHVARELMFGPARFTDLLEALPGTSTSALTQRLKDLDAAGVVTRRRLPPPAATWVYELTDWGRGLRPVIIELGRWGTQSASYVRGGPISPAAFAFSLLARFDRERAGDAHGRIGLRLADSLFLVELDGGRLDIAGAAGDEVVDAWVSAPTAAVLRDLLFTGDLSDGALADAGIDVTGDRAAAEAVLAAVRGEPARAA